MTPWQRFAQLLAGLMRGRRRAQAQPPVRMRVKRTRVTKWDGDPPAANEKRLPAEVVEHDFERGIKRIYRPVNGQLQEVTDDTGQG